MRLEKTMFREYDIRGRESENELNELSMYHIARGFARLENMIKNLGVAGKKGRAYFFAVF